MFVRTSKQIDNTEQLRNDFNCLSASDPPRSLDCYDRCTFGRNLRANPNLGGFR